MSTIHALNGLELIAQGTTLSNLRAIVSFYGDESGGEWVDDLLKPKTHSGAGSYWWESYHWAQLYAIIEDNTRDHKEISDAAAFWAAGLVPFYRKIWRKLGFPGTLLEWLNAKNGA